MSAPGSDCIVCGRPALQLNGLDGGFPSYREFRAVWDPPRVFQDMIHFSCLRTWEHRDAMLAELVALATGSVLEWDMEHEGKTYHITRSGLGYTDELFRNDSILVLQHNFSADCLIVDFSGSWQFIGRRRLLRLVRDQEVAIEDGWGHYGLFLSPAPPESVVLSWSLGDLLRHLRIENRYPGLVQSGAELKALEYSSRNGHFVHSIHHRVSIHPDALEYFRKLYDDEGESAFDSVAMSDK